MKVKFIVKSFMTLAALLLSFNANAASFIDVGVTSANESRWEFSDGTSALSPAYNGPAVGVYGGTTPGFSGWWRADFYFSVINLDSSQPSFLNVSAFGADDRAALLINDQLLQQVGIFAPGVGEFDWVKPVFSSSETIYPEHETGLLFAANYGYSDLSGGPYSFDLSEILLEGLNTLSIIINDTDSGIYGYTTEYVGVQQYSSFRFLGEVSYAQTTVVPEPSTFILLGIGLLGLGLCTRRHKQA
jgi:hypothetical protein